MPAAELSACHSGPSASFFGALAPSTDIARQRVCRMRGRWPATRSKKSPETMFRAFSLPVMAPVVVPIIIGTTVVGVRLIAVIGRPVITRAVAVIAIARSIITVRTVRAGRGAGGECAGGQAERKSRADAPRL